LQNPFIKATDRPSLTDKSSFSRHYNLSICQKAIWSKSPLQSILHLELLPSSTSFILFQPILFLCVLFIIFSQCPK